MKSEPNEFGETEETEEVQQTDAVTQEVMESLPGYQEFMRERKSESEGLTFGDY